METNIKKHLHLGVAVMGAVHIAWGIKFAQQTQSNPLHCQKELEKTSALKSKAIMDNGLRSVCLSVPSGKQTIFRALVSPLRCPFISPECHIGGPDNWTWALASYIKFKGRYVFHFLDGLGYCWKLTETCLCAHQSRVSLEVAVCIIVVWPSVLH